MSKYAKTERETKFRPLMSDYEKFTRQQDSERGKRIPEVGAKLPAQKPEVKKMQEKMQRSLVTSSEPAKQPAKQVVKPSPAPAKERREPKFIAGYEKAGKPSQIRVGGTRPESSKEQIEARKRMLRMKKGKR